MTKAGRKRSGGTIKSGEACYRCAELLGTTVQHLRELAAVVPDSNLVSNAKQKGIARSIKKLSQQQRFIPQGRVGNKTLVRLVTTKIEVVDAQRAIAQLLKVYGLRNRFKKPT